MNGPPPLVLRQQLLYPGLAFLVAAVGFEVSDIDRAVARLFFDEQRGLWTYGDSRLFNEWLHEGGRNAIFLIGLAGVVTLLLAPLSARCRRWRRSAGFLVASIGLATGLVAGLKKITNVDCPWNLEGFGGDRPYVHLFQDRPDHLPRGGCFPGGHSSGAFSLFAVFFVLRERHGRAAWLALIGVITLGMVFGLGQWARGAHFPSHSVWSASLCWMVVLGLYWGPFRGRLWPVTGPRTGE